MFWKRHRKVFMLSLAFALGVGSFVSMGGHAEAASAMDLFNQVYKQATGSHFQGFDSVNNEVKPPVKPKPDEPQQPDPGEVTKPDKPTKPKPQPTQPGQASVADRILATGEKYMGTPYKYGASYGQTRTFDCSSFTKTVFAENGITLPRSSRQQATVGTPVSRNQLQKGDLIFTSTSYSSNISHVAIYAGNDRVLHTYGPGGVRYDKFSGSWLDRAYITARRVIK